MEEYYIYAAIVAYMACNAIIFSLEYKWYRWFFIFLGVPYFLISKVFYVIAEINYRVLEFLGLEFLFPHLKILIFEMEKIPVTYEKIKKCLLIINSQDKKTLSFINIFIMKLIVYRLLQRKRYGFNFIKI